MSPSRGTHGAALTSLLAGMLLSIGYGGAWAAPVTQGANQVAQGEISSSHGDRPLRAPSRRSNARLAAPLSAPQTAPTCTSAWTFVGSPNNPNDNVLTGLAPISSSDMWAVGFHTTGGLSPIDQPEALHWDGSSWTLPAAQPGVVDTSHNDLNAAAAVATNNVWAVGHYLNTTLNAFQTLIEHYDGTSWTVVSSPNLSSFDNFLFAAAATSATDVWAVGFYYAVAGGVRNALIEHYNGSVWTAMATNAPGATSLFGVSASSTSDAWVVGHLTGSVKQTFIEHWNGTAWSVVASPDQTLNDNFLEGVADLSTNAAWATGEYKDPVSGALRTLVQQWNGTGWTIVPSPSVGGTGSDDYLFSVSAASPTNVWAAGSAYSPVPQPSTGYVASQPLTEHWNGTQWSVFVSPTPSTWTELLAIATTGPTSVWTAGDFFNGSTFNTLTENLCVPTPAVAGVSPTRGPTAGGNTVTITGSGYTFATGVQFGATSASAFTVNSDTSLTATAPAGTPGTVHVTVTNYAGTSSTSAADQYTYVLPPTVGSVVPNSGPVTGGTGVTITGTGFTGASAVSFSATPAASFTVVSDTSITAVSPPHCPGIVDVIVTAPGGTNTATQTDQFTFTGNACSVVSSNQYHLANNDGSTWVAMDATSLSLTVTPAVDSSVVASANVDLWTANAGYNQDIGIAVSGGTAPAPHYPTLANQPEAWKESGGFAGTFSPNAAFVQTVLPLAANTPYTFTIVWKANKADAGTIYAGAGPIGSKFSSTRLSVQLVPTVAAGPGSLMTAASTKQYNQAGSDGKTWKAMDTTSPTPLTFTYPAPGDGWVILSGNADLWTSSAGYNQDLGIAVSGGTYPTVANQPEAWKESGGFAGTFSPNAAFVQTAIQVKNGVSYAVTLVWKANKADAGTIWAGAGPIGTAYSPTRLTLQFVPASTPAQVLDAASTLQYPQTGSDGVTWNNVDNTSSTPLTLSFSSASVCLALLSGNADLWTSSAGYNQDLGIGVAGGAFPTVSGQPEAWKESGGFAGTFSPNAAFVQTVITLQAGVTYTATIQWKANKADVGTIWIGAGPIGTAFSPTHLTVQLMACS